LKYEAVIFDNAGVLFQDIHVIGEKLKWIMPRTAEKLEKEFISDDFRNLIFGEITEDEFLVNLKNKYKWEAQIDDLKNAVREILTPVPGTLDVVKELHDKGTRLALLSGHAKEWVFYLQEKYKFHALFDKILYSYMTGYGKEKIEFYKDILQMLGLEGSQVICIDDKQYHLDVAVKTGMRTLLFENAEQLKKDLNSLVSL